MKCHDCGSEWTMPGEVLGSWRCPDCCERRRLEERRRHQGHLDLLRARHAAGRCIIHIPGPAPPPGASDEEAQAFCDEHLCCCWDRADGGAIRTWVEM